MLWSQNKESAVLETTVHSEFSKGPLASIQLKQFRNLSSLEFQPHPEFNFFFGDNAQGKTSILEAIFFLSELKSFRTTEMNSLVHHGETLGFLGAEVNARGLTHDLKIQIQSQGKQILLNGKAPRPLRQLRKLMPAVLFTPDSVRLFRSSPGTRRDYFDHLFGLLSESFSADVAEYHRILRQKQELLDQARSGTYSGHSSAEWETWNEKLATLGARVIFERLRFTEELSFLLQSYFEELSGGEWQGVLSYQPYLRSIEKGQAVAEIQNLLGEEIVRRTHEEIERNQVLVGPHRDDWSFKVDQALLREEGSQGQHRLAVAALKLAEVEMIGKKEMTPLALFDDLLSELDSVRVSRVLTLLKRCPCQVFLTSVTPMGVSLQGLEGQAFQVKGGKVYNCNG
jgi:DNA replication and repair protein RecF